MQQGPYHIRKNVVRMAKTSVNSACWVIFHSFLSSEGVFFFLLLSFSKISYRNTIRVSNILDPDQAQRLVGLGLDPNCLQSLSARKESKNVQPK